MENPVIHYSFFSRCMPYMVKHVVLPEDKVNRPEAVPMPRRRTMRSLDLLEVYNRDRRILCKILLPPKTDVKKILESISGEHENAFREEKGESYLYNGKDIAAVDDDAAMLQYYKRLSNLMKAGREKHDNGLYGVIEGAEN